MRTHKAVQYPIPLNEKQESAVKDWAADDRLWNNQPDREFNLRTFTRVILSQATEHPLTGDPVQDPIISMEKPK